MRLSVGDKEPEVTARHDDNGEERSDGEGGEKAVESIGQKQRHGE